MEKKKKKKKKNSTVIKARTMNILMKMIETFTAS